MKPQQSFAHLSAEPAHVPVSQQRSRTVSSFSLLADRLKVHTLQKAVASTLGLTGFFVAYVWLLDHPAYPVTVMPVTALDGWFDFHPEAIFIYLSLWFYISLCPALLVDKRELLSYGYATLLLSVLGLVIFYFFPTTVPPADSEWSKTSTFAFLDAVDASGNACPSLHVAFAVFSGCWLDRLLSRLTFGIAARSMNWLWCTAILYSTIAVRQHVVLDIAAGALLGWLAVFGHFLWLKRNKITPA